ncbi:type II-A CRISPR-associated protein Csn2 [Ructibacterium gallinarum]|uniref:Type II-A CRISPR-associated protein Csn2 n=1 Tax=Ructibacterium gallinarum TaxID=2779355 RepID=A0A9D5M4L9_9FIRM|nr:type II-A CRISPR-associated protein Csn2 [Ructibacterium gallinarum]MBE5040619.1 type II-A CRISPR-associated protein Csn2 [Ructibacterium gallinarum]
MKLIFPLLQEQLDLGREDKVNVLVIENPSYFVHFLNEIWKASQKETSEIVFSSQHVPLDMAKKLEILQTFVPFETNRKNLVTKLYQYAEKVMMGEEFFVSTQKLMQDHLDYITKIAQNLPFPLDFSDTFEVSYLMKAVDLRFDTAYASLGEQVVDYMESVTMLEGEKCFVLVNLRDYISDREMDAFYQTVLYKKLKVLVVSAKDYPLSGYETKTIIDHTLCVI